MAKDFFAEFVDKTEERRSFAKKSSAIEVAGYIAAAVILATVVVVMTSEIKLISFSEVTELSLAVFVLIYLSHSMYVNMYNNGTLAAKKLEEYVDVTRAYFTIRDEMKTKTVQKDLAQFCREYVANELRAQRESVLEPADVSWAEYQRLKNLTYKELKEKGIPKIKRKAIIDANWIKPIKLTPTMIYRACGRGVRIRPMGTAPDKRRRFDYVFSFARTALTSLCMCFIAFELFANPTWEMLCAVVIKLVTVALNGLLGYRRGYDNIAVDTINYTEDQIDMLEQFREWRAPEVIVTTITTDNLLREEVKA